MAHSSLQQQQNKNNSNHGGAGDNSKQTSAQLAVDDEDARTGSPPYTTHILLYEMSGARVFSAGQLISEECSAAFFSSSQYYAAAWASCTTLARARRKPFSKAELRQLGTYSEEQKAAD